MNITDIVDRIIGHTIDREFEDAERSKFEEFQRARYKIIDLSRARQMRHSLYAHSNVESAWNGWLDRARVEQIAESAHQRLYRR